MSEILEKATGVTQSIRTGLNGEIGTSNTYGGNGGSDLSNNAGGALLPTQSRQFIDYIFDQMVLAKDGRRVVMQANTMELDKINVGARRVRKANQAGLGIIQASDGTATTPSYPYTENLGDAFFTKVEVTTTKFRLDYELSTEALEDNIEGAGLEDHIARLMAVQFGNDLEDIAINGDSGNGTLAGTSGQGQNNAGYYFGTIDGFIKKIKAAAAGDNNFGASNAVASATIYTSSVSGFDTTAGSAIQAVEALYNKLPRKFLARRNELKLYASSKNVSTLLTDLRKVGYSGGIGNATQEVANEVLNGGRPRVGGPAGYNTQLFGIPILEVPLYPDWYTDITFPTNRIWGFQRDITVHREFKPKKDTVEYTVYVRMGINIEEGSAVAYSAAQ